MRGRTDLPPLRFGEGWGGVLYMFTRGLITYKARYYRAPTPKHFLSVWSLDNLFQNSPFGFGIETNQSYIFAIVFS